MYNRIELMLPTFKRIEGLKTFIESAKKTATGEIRFHVCVNEDDTATLEFLAKEYPEIKVVKEDTLQPNLSLYWNLLYDSLPDEDTVVTMVADDMEFITHGWDARVLDEINKRNGEAVVYLNDDYIAGEKLCVNLFTTKKIVAASKKPFMCPMFHADMIDLVWFFVGVSTSTLVYLGDVVLRHNHETRKPPARRDENFQRLSPIQQLYRNPNANKMAMAYATISSKNIIDAGMGRWNVL